MEDKEREQYQTQMVLDIKKTIIVSFIIIATILGIIFFSLYIAEENFRKWVDVNVLRKSITSNDVVAIDLDVEKNNQVYCYNKYISILNDKNLAIYNTSGEKMSDISVNINTAIFNSSDKYLAIAEENGQEFCVIYDRTFLWKEEIDGEIIYIYINKNGYVVVVTTDTTYKSIITLYDSEGNQLLKNYISSTRVVDAQISQDNKYIAYAEIDTSGALIQSNVKILSVEKAKKSSNEAIEYSKENKNSKMILKTKYQDKNKLICVYDDVINIINEGKETEILNIDNQTTFVSGNLSNSVAYIKEEHIGIFNAKSVLTIINTSNNQQYTYDFDGIAKEMYTYENVIGINIGTDIYFVNQNGNLIKEYTSSQEITNVVLSKELAAIIYKDRVEIIKL